MEFNVIEEPKDTWHLEIRATSDRDYPSAYFDPIRCSPDFATRQEALTALAEAMRALVVGRVGGREARQSTGVHCRGCERGLKVLALDADGTLVSVSKRPVVTVGHAVEEYWWACPRAMAGLIPDSEIQR